MLATVTIEPRSPSTRFCSIILASAALATRNVPVRLIPITRSHSLRSSRCTGPPPATPAAWNTPSRRSGTAASTAAMASSSVTSAVRKWKSAPRSGGAATSAPMTVPPSASRRRAVARPMPDAAPVTTNVRDRARSALTMAVIVAHRCARTALTVSLWLESGRIPAPGAPSKPSVHTRCVAHTHADGATQTLAGLVERHARRRPDGIAIRYGERQWSWAQWASRIRRAAGALQAAGVRRGDRVAFLDKNHPACLEILFAAASIGAATTVVNWRVMGDELAHVLADSRPRLLFVGAELRPAAEAAAARVDGLDRIVVIDDEYEALLAAAPPARAAEVDEDETALVIYSSGTTGRPKGVLLSQRALVNHAANLAPAFPFGDADANLVAMPLFHVGGIGYALFGIRAGVPTIMTREPDAAALMGAVRSGATHAFFVPPVIARFLDAGEAAHATVAGLRYIVYGAAPMPLPLLHRALSTWPDTRFVQVYGQTELCGAVTALSDEDHRDSDRPHLQLAAGRAVLGTDIRVV